MRDSVLKQGLKQMDAEELRELRKSRRESQSTFWKRFGVTQSRGSRFEQGLEIPASVAILLRLYLDGKISDGDLWRAKRGAGMLKKISFFNHASPG
jgi:transcriptional regulator with XRE-family HTH domain